MSDIKMPERPKFRSLSDVAKEELEFPYFLSGVPIVDAQTGKPVFSSDDSSVAVGVGNLSLRKQMQYESIYGESIDTTVNKILYIYYTMSKIQNPEIDSNPIPELTVDEYQRVITPMGPMMGSLDRNIIETCTFILSCYGRIVGQESNGKYKYVDISQEEILDICKGNVFTDPFDDNTVAFMEIFMLAGLWNPNDVSNKLKEEGTLTEAEDDELKNSA